MITFVKKVRTDGSFCGKCVDVENRLIESGNMSLIDRVVIADESDPESEGMRLAATHSVSSAPFFIVEREQQTQIYTVYFKFIRDIAKENVTQELEASELADQFPELDLL